MMGRKLAYGGYPIDELVEHAASEEICLLLWNGERPAAAEVDDLRAEIASAQMPAPVAAALATVNRDAAPLLRLAVMMPALAAAELHLQLQPRINQARLIISMMPLALATGSERAAQGANAAPRDGTAGLAALLLTSFFGDQFTEWELVPLERMLIACAEHELNTP